MKEYRANFKEYLDDLGKKEPSPGGGSTVCLIFCTGVSLIEKAINYSFTDSNKSKDKKLQRYLKKFNVLRRLVYPYIDKDSYVFGMIMHSKRKKRDKFVEKSNDIIGRVGNSCCEAFSLAKGIESDIKKSIISDFNIGLELTKSALLGCILNSEANQKIFGKKSKYTNRFKTVLKRWR